MMNNSSLGIVNIDRTIEVIASLYGNTDGKTKEEASKWLTELQKSNEAWVIANDLVNQKKDFYSWYFGAQTLRNKIQSSFAELDPRSHESLRVTLINTIVNCDEQTPSAISNQLCLAVADLVCTMISWERPIVELIHKLSTTPHLSYLIDILHFIPEELSNSTMHLGENRRNQVISECEKSKELFVKLLDQTIRSQSHNLRLIEKIFICLGSWWRNTGVMDNSDLLDKCIIEAMFTLLHRPDQVDESTYVAVSECLMDIFYSIPNPNLYPDTSSKLQAGTYELLPVYRQCCASSMTSQARLLCRIFVEMAYCFLQTIISTTPNSLKGLSDMRTIDCVIVCVELGERYQCLYAFDLLRDFASEITKKQNSSLIEPSTPYFARLVMGVTRHCHFTQMSAEIAEEFEEFRNAVFDLMHEVVHIIGAEQMCAELMNHLSDCFLPVKEGRMMQSEQWNAMEALLFILSSILKRVNPNDEEGRIENLVNSLLWLMSSESQYNVPMRVREVICLMFGQLDAWSARHINSSTSIHTFLVHTVLTIHASPAPETDTDQRECVRSCLHSLGAMYKMTSNQHMLIQIKSHEEIQRLLNCLPSLPWALHDAEEELFYGLGASLNALLFPNRLRHEQESNNDLNSVYNDQAPAQCLRSILLIPVDCVNKLVENRNQLGTPAHHSLTDIGLWLDFIAAVFSRINIGRFADQIKKKTNPEYHLIENAISICLEQVIMQSVWPALSRAMSAFYTVDRILEKSTRVVRYIVRSLGIYASPLLPVIVPTLIDIYSASRHSAFLYLGKIFVDEFSSSHELIPSLTQLFVTLVNPVLQNISKLEHEHDLMEDLFRLCNGMIAGCANNLFVNEHVSIEYLLTTAACVLSETVNVSVNTALAAFNFLTACLWFIRDVDNAIINNSAMEIQIQGMQRLKKWLLTPSNTAIGHQPIGQEGALFVLCHCIRSVCSTKETDIYTDAADFVFALKNICSRAQLECWCETAVMTLPLNRADGLELVTAKQKNDFKFAVIESDSARDICRALDRFSRLFR